MIQLLAARVDRQERILVNARLDSYPAFFYIIPAAVNLCLQCPASSHLASLALLENHWQQLAPILERLVRSHGNDFVATEEMLVARPHQSNNTLSK
jgi:hypothetical protein